MSKKLTPWFDGSVKPVREGVYMLLCGFGKKSGYQHWDGATWGAWAPTAHEAKFTLLPAASASHQNDKWRGLAEKPE